ncbi:MAG TPA: CPCC family cysteine-rich protein [Oculatellaceae cyanobacterium]
MIDENNQKSNSRLPCMCCGHPTILERGSYEICEVCNWEDDPVQANYPDMSGGANEESLNEAKATFFRNK